MIPTWIIASILLSIFTLCSSSGLFQVRLTSQHTSSAQICVKKWRAKQFDSCLVESKLIPVGPDQQNIFELPFMFPWPTLFSLIVNSFDRNGVRLDSVIVQEQLGRNSGWKNGNKSPKDMAISYRILCQKSYFGIGCEKFCQNTDQYSCSSEGERLCRPGWTGDNCENAICSNGCSHGKCTSPDVCTCDPGFSGLACNQCQPRENCQHGFCQDNQPFTCACEPGWGGIFCERDLEFCTRHSPCRNGGICSNGGSAGYTCSCPEGFIGSSCEIALPSICEHQGICRNG
uniref:Delta-like protein n=1 Tax=Heterorhabditis bacteriophora TaxID=37862 RepID=A0A1I7XK48_HETBA